MTRIRIALTAMMMVAAATLPARAQEPDTLSSGSDSVAAVLDSSSAAGLRPDSLTSVSRGPAAGSECNCPKEGRWDALNLEGSMDCKGAVALSKKLGEVRDDGVIFVMEDDCSRVFGDSMDGDEDVLMTRVEDGCGYEGTIEGEHEGVTMVIDLLWTVEDQGFIRGEMSSSTNMGPITCDLYRPYELTYDEPLSEKDYQKWLKRIEEKIQKLEEKRKGDGR